MKRSLIFLTVFLSLALPAEAQELWAKTQAGMSVDEVKKIFPDAIQPSSTTHGHGMERLLTIPNIMIQEKPFRVVFLFRDKQLDRVALYYNGPEQSFGTLMLLYDSILNILRAKYGKEINHLSQREDLIQFKQEQHTWFFEGREIVLSLQSHFGKENFFTVLYTTDIAKDLNKL